MCKLHETLYCEQCGESPQEISLKHAGLCLDCASNALSEELTEVLGYRPCGELLHFHSTDTKAICIAPWGSEHDHSAIDYQRPNINPPGADEEESE